jgi:hypothetical protein
LQGVSGIAADPNVFCLLTIFRLPHTILVFFAGSLFQ